MLQEQQKPIISTIEYAGVKYPYLLATAGSNEHYFATIKLKKHKSKTEAERHANFAIYISSLIVGWPTESDELFDGKYTEDKALSICMNIRNAWLLTAIHKEVNSNIKKPEKTSES